MQVGDTIYRFFRVPDPSDNGANVDADDLPTAILRKHGVTVGAASVSVAKISTGYYQASVLLDAAHGWVLGDTWSIDVSYDVSGNSTTRCIAGGTIAIRQTGDHADAIAAIPSAILATPDNKLATNEDGTVNITDAIEVDVDELAAGVWSYTTRTLTMTASQIAAVVSGDEVTMYRATSLSLSITGLGSIADRSKLWVSGKRQPEQADTKAAFRIEETAGLQRIAGSAPSDAADGTITVDDEAAGDITVTLTAEQTALLSTFEDGNLDVKVLRTGGDIDLLDLRTLNIRHPVTHAVE